MIIFGKKIRDDFSCGKITTQEFIKKGSKSLNLSKKEFLERYKNRHYKTKIHKKTIKIFKTIKLKKYILSDNNLIYSKLDKIKFPIIFKEADKIFLSENIKMKKDTIKTFKHVLGKIRLKGHEVIMIDDEMNNLKNAKKAGINIIHYKKPPQLIRELKRLGINI